MSSHSTASQLLIEGIAAARAGETAEAQRLLRRVTEIEPGNPEAWIWRADVAETSADKKAFLEEALTLDPGNREATAALERIAKLEGDLAARAEDEPLFCTVHPERETMLRCNRCGRPMCTECAVRHPVGLRCRECVRQTRSPIYQVGSGTTGVALLAATAISTVIGLLVLLFGGVVWWFFWIPIGGALGGAISGVVQRVVPRKRGRPIQIATGAGVLLGLLLAAAGLSFFATGGPAGILRFGLQFHVLLYLGTAIAGAIAALR